jgi:nucleotide-binding universal stress UspA family protein
MAITFEHILIPYNGTTGSNKAFRKAISLASSINAKITVLTCLEERPTFGFFKTKTSKQEFEKEHKLIEKQHLDLEKLAKKHDIPFSSKIVKNGMASVKILEFAKQHDVDLIIMTKTKISSRYEKQHYQSTIENVFRNAHCPILIL